MSRAGEKEQKKNEEAHRIENRISHGANTSKNQVANSHDDAIHLLYKFVILNKLHLIFSAPMRSIGAKSSNIHICLHNAGTKGSPIIMKVDSNFKTFKQKVNGVKYRNLHIQD